MGDGSVYECANCGEASGMMGHYDSTVNRFKCERKSDEVQQDAVVVSRTRQIDKSAVAAAVRHLSWVSASDVTDSRFADGKKIVVLESKYHDVTFEDLTQLSEIFGTRDINLGSETREGGYCETCRFNYDVTIITIMNPSLAAQEV